MRVALIALAACGASGVARQPRVLDPGDSTHSSFADDDSDRPSYRKAELERALIAERAAVATAEQHVAELGLGAAADLGVRRRFLSSLEVCAAEAVRCPPRLDNPSWHFDVDGDGAKPPLDTPLRFDLADWRKIADELHGRACACRTLACVDSLGVAIDQLEARPMRDVEADEIASASITHARECLYRLRAAKLPRPGES